MNQLFLNTINFGINHPSDLDGGIVRLVLMIVIPIAIIQLVLLITALVSLVKKEVHAMDKLIWGLVIVCINIIGPIVYFAIGSNMLDQKAAELEEQNEQRENRLQ